MPLSFVKLKPVTPFEHCLLDWIQAPVLIAAPELFGLTGATAWIVRTFGITQLAVNALTDTPAGLHRSISAPDHAAIEKWGGFASLALALLTDGGRENNRAFLLGHTLLATAIYNLTDYHGDPDA